MSSSRNANEYNVDIRAFRDLVDEIEMANRGPQSDKIAAIIKNLHVFIELIKNNAVHEAEYIQKIYGPLIQPFQKIMLSKEQGLEEVKAKLEKVENIIDKIIDSDAYKKSSSAVKESTVSAAAATVPAHADRHTSSAAGTRDNQQSRMERIRNMADKLKLNKGKQQIEKRTTNNDAPEKTNDTQTFRRK